MKNTLLIVWNVLLTIGLAFLLAHLWKEQAPDTAAMPPASVNKTDSNTAIQRIAFVNVDSLEAHYLLYEQKKKELQVKQQSAENTLNNKLQAFQKDYADAQQQAATMTQSQLEEVQNKLQKEQADIQDLQTSLQNNFQSQLDQFNKELKDSLDSFIRYYNAGKKYAFVLSYGEVSDILYGEPQYDITADAIKGMNNRLKK